MTDKTNVLILTCIQAIVLMLILRGFELIGARLWITFAGLFIILIIAEFIIVFSFMMIIEMIPIKWGEEDE